MRFAQRLAAALLALPLLLIAPAAAQAHDTLESTVPKDGATTAPVQSVSMRFNGAVLTTGAAVTVSGPDGPAAQGAPSINGATVTQALKTPQVDGAYVVTWRVLSADGHPISGTFKFTVAGAPKSSTPAQQSAASTPATATTSAATSSAPTPPVQQVPTTSTDNNAPLIITGAVLALLLIVGGAYLAKARLKGDNADLEGSSTASDTNSATPISPASTRDGGAESSDSTRPAGTGGEAAGRTIHDVDGEPDD